MVRTAIREEQKSGEQGRNQSNYIFLLALPVCAWYDWRPSFPKFTGRTLT